MSIEDIELRFVDALVATEPGAEPTKKARVLQWRKLVSVAPKTPAGGVTAWTEWEQVPYVPGD